MFSWGWSNRRRRVAVLTLLAGALGCPQGAARDDDGDGDSVRRGEVELSIGAENGPDALIFSRIGGLAVDPAGRIFAADVEANEVRVFQPDGRFAFRIGRGGQGPGDLSGPCCLALRDDGRTLWVRDGGNARYQSFAVGDTSAAHRTFLRFAHTDINRGAPLTFDAEGNLVDIGAGTRDDEGRVPIIRYHLDSSSRVVRADTLPEPPKDSLPVHTVTRSVGGNSVTMFVYPSYPPLALHAHSPRGEWARAVSSRYSIAWYDADGRVLRTLERQMVGPPLSAAERARADSQLNATAARRQIARGEIPFGVPDRKQPLRDLFFDGEGRLWVELYVAESEPPTAHVYSPDGRFLFTAQWPPRTAIAAGAGRDDVVYGVQRDSLDVQRIVRIRLR